MADYIRIAKKKLKNQYLINFKNVLCEEDYLSVKVDEEKISLNRIGIDFVGKHHKVTNNTFGWAMTSISADLEDGKYEIDEDESNDDSIVAYFEDKIK